MCERFSNVDGDNKGTYVAGGHVNLKTTSTLDQSIMGTRRRSVRLTSSPENWRHFSFPIQPMLSCMEKHQCLECQKRRW